MSVSIILLCVLTNQNSQEVTNIKLTKSRPLIAWIMNNLYRGLNLFLNTSEFRCSEDVVKLFHFNKTKHKEVIKKGVKPLITLLLTIKRAKFWLKNIKKHSWFKVDKDNIKAKKKWISGKLYCSSPFWCTLYIVSNFI